MPRISPVEAASDEASARLIADIRSQRGGQFPLLYQVLMNSPPIAEGWLNLLTAVRQKTQLPGRLRELVILRIAILNQAPYEFHAHAGVARAEGTPDAIIEALRRGEVPDELSAAEKAALAYTDEMTRNIHVAPAIYAALEPHFGAREIVELTVTVASYNMVSRFLEALSVKPEDEKPG